MPIAYELKLSRVYLAGAVGSVIGGVLGTVLQLAWSIMHSGGVEPNEWTQIRIQIFGFSILASIVFLIGLVTLGVPGWLIMHRLGRRRWFDAMALGAVLAFAAYFAISYLPLILHSPGSDYSSEDGGIPTIEHYQLTAQGWRFLIEGASIQAVAGAVAGLTIWRICYQRKSVP